MPDLSVWNLDVLLTYYSFLFKSNQHMGLGLIRMLQETAAVRVVQLRQCGGLGVKLLFCSSISVLRVSL